MSCGVHSCWTAGPLDGPLDHRTAGPPDEEPGTMNESISLLLDSPMLLDAHFGGRISRTWTGIVYPVLSCFSCACRGRDTDLLLNHWSIVSRGLIRVATNKRAFDGE